MSTHPLLQQPTRIFTCLQGQLEDIMDRFKKLKGAIPVMGAILLDQTLQRVLLVKGWKSTACWGFPKGKINKNENEAECAAREVLEETGYDIDGLIRPQDFLEQVLDGKRTRLYIVPGLDPDTQQFAPKCRGEIGGYAWHTVADLPCTKEQGSQTYNSADGTKYKFYGVWPFMKRLRAWIKKYQQSGGAAQLASGTAAQLDASGGSQSSTCDSQDYFAPALLSPSGGALPAGPVAPKSLAAFTFDTSSIVAAMQLTRGR